MRLNANYSVYVSIYQEIWHKRLGHRNNNDIKVMGIHNIRELDAEIDKSDVIGIDEGQFYNDLYDKVEEYVNKDKIIIVSALDGTFERKPFG